MGGGPPCFKMTYMHVMFATVLCRNSVDIRLFMERLLFMGQDLSLHIPDMRWLVHYRLYNEMIF